MRRWAADLVTGLRIVGAPLLAWSLGSGRWAVAAVLVTAAVASDIGDGWAARRLGTASTFGRWLDHVADIVFLLAGFTTLAWQGAVPAFVPAAIAAAFSFYVVDSLRQSPARTLVGSRLGHLSGILNYAVLTTVVVDAAVGEPLPRPLIDAVLLAVPVYSGAAIAGRLARVRRPTDP